MMANPTISQEDYTAMAGPDWPSYQEFCTGVDIPEFVRQEINTMLGAVEAAVANTSNFCILPFFGREYPADVHCCQLPSGYDIASIQSDMLQNRRNSQCSACWRLEDAGVKSDRQIKNETIDHYTNTDLTEFYRRAQTGDTPLIHYKIDAGNYCNSTCVTCNKGSSSSWGILENQYYGTKIPTVELVKENNPNISIDYANAVFIGFTGGEPTMIRTNWQILEQLIRADNTGCCISFVTNGSFVPTPKQTQILDQFENVNFCFSLDGTGPVFEYMRFPLSWQQTTDNIQRARDRGYMISASYTISNLNVLYHVQTTDWFKSQDIVYLENPVYAPDYYAPGSLRSDIKQHILESTDNPTVQLYLGEHSERDEQRFRRCLENIQLQDDMKKIDYRTYLPELAQLIG